MALNKAIEFKGTTLNYHKLISKSENAIQTTSKMASYISREARTADINNYVSVSERQFDGVDLTRDELYPLWKTGEFADAEDC